jgi:hypothetical protein
MNFTESTHLMQALFHELTEYHRVPGSEIKQFVDDQEQVANFAAMIRRHAQECAQQRAS